MFMFNLYGCVYKKYKYIYALHNKHVCKAKIAIENVCMLVE